MPKSPTLETLLGLGCKGDRAAKVLRANGIIARERTIRLFRNRERTRPHQELS